ncbi:MAG TPA: S1/P1 nuclease [Bryobacteraceae bacterium]|nr:S1/P1 nuclease [Bryobacteraceae bacterium]
MSRLRVAALGLAALLFAPPAPAWNFVTHRVIAAMAYDQLKSSTRARVDALIKQHPDYATLFVKNASANEPARARAAFIEAAVWADQIRTDPRFYDETRPDAEPTPLLPGFPDMQRHGGWHFIDLPFSQDGTALESAAAPNLVTELDRLMTELARPGGANDPSQRAYDLVWLIHLIGDVHAPLHCVSRFSVSEPKGDQGGNLVFVSVGNSAEGITLHKYWDDAVGTDTSPGWVNRTSTEILRSHPSGEPSNEPQQFSPQAWAQESLSTAKIEIYRFGPENGSHQRPVSLPAGYRANAKKVAEAQVAKAASRLAAFLSLRL